MFPIPCSNANVFSAAFYLTFFSHNCIYSCSDCDDDCFGEPLELQPEEYTDLNVRFLNFWEFFPSFSLVVHLYIGNRCSKQMALSWSFTYIVRFWISQKKRGASLAIGFSASPVWMMVLFVGSGVGNQSYIVTFIFLQVYLNSSLNHLNAVYFFLCFIVVS